MRITLKARRSRNGLIYLTILVITAYFIYPRIIFSIHGKIPGKWDTSLSEFNFDEIYHKLGPPQDNLSAKGYQIWVDEHWWGKKILMLMADKCCEIKDKPEIVVYRVYVNWWYNPIYQKVIYDKNPIHAPSEMRV